MNKHEPLFHVTKNDAMPAWKALLIRVIAILAALLVVGILSVILIQKNPIEIYEVMFTGPFVDVWTLLQNTALMLFFGLAVIPAFRMKYWNMGANGQVLMGCLAAIACMRYFTSGGRSMALPLLILIMFAASILAAVVWAVIPAVFKAFFNTNETLFTLMMNYIAIAVVDFMVFSWDKSGQGNIGVVNLFTHDGWIPDIGNKYLLSIIVALALAVIMYVYIKFTKHGFEVDLVGESVNTAKYAGINVKKVVIRTLVFCGVICGILGALYAGSISHTVNSSVGGKGFTAILVAWLANFNPIIMILTSFFTVYVTSGSEHISTAFQLNSNDYANIVVGVIFFFVIGCEFFIRYKIQLNPTWRAKLGLKKKDKEREVNKV